MVSLLNNTQTVAGVEFCELNPATLAPNPLNYQKHSKAQRDALKKSIEEHGWVAFPIFNKRTQRLIDGHARVEEANRKGCDSILCVIVDKDERSEQRLLASFDKIGRMASSDDAILSSLLQSIEQDSDNDIAGWIGEEIDDILSKSHKEIDREVKAIEKAHPPSGAAPASRRNGEQKFIFSYGGEALVSFLNDLEAVKKWFVSETKEDATNAEVVAFALETMAKRLADGDEV